MNNEKQSAQPTERTPNLHSELSQILRQFRMKVIG